MAASTGPVLAAGGLVIFNAVIVHGKTPASQTRVMVASFIAAGGLALWERAMPRTAVAVSWLILLSTILVRTTPDVPAPIESFQQWYTQK